MTIKNEKEIRDAIEKTKVVNADIFYQEKVGNYLALVDIEKLVQALTPYLAQVPEWEGKVWMTIDGNMGWMEIKDKKMKKFAGQTVRVKIFKD